MPKGLFYIGKAVELQTNQITKYIINVLGLECIKRFKHNAQRDEKWVTSL